MSIAKPPKKANRHIEEHKPYAVYLLQVDLQKHSEWAEKCEGSTTTYLAAKAKQSLAEEFKAVAMKAGLSQAYWAGDGGLFYSLEGRTSAESIVACADKIRSRFLIWREKNQKLHTQDLNLRISAHWSSEVWVVSNTSHWLSSDLNAFLKNEKAIGRAEGLAVTEPFLRRLKSSARFRMLRLEANPLPWKVFYDLPPNTSGTGEVFCDDFSKGLADWDYQGDWHSRRVDGKYFLEVTGSDRGGVVSQCGRWTDYIFRFQTMIANKNTSWLMRASDLGNYAMLQCEPTRINPHFRIQGQWWLLRSRPLPMSIPLGTWFNVGIHVRGTNVQVDIAVDGTSHRVLDESLFSGTYQMQRLGTAEFVGQTVQFPSGSVGFREDADEKAYFRHIEVTRG